MTDNLFRHFFAGFVRLHILYHAAKEPICGVEIIEELKRHGYDLSAGTLYPILHGLENMGYLTSTPEVVGGKRRRNYRITKHGQTMLADGQKKVRELVSEVIEDKDLRAVAEKRPRR